jgi:hypothetical protein
MGYAARVGTLCAIAFLVNCKPSEPYLTRSTLPLSPGLSHAWCLAGRLSLPRSQSSTLYTRIAVLTPSPVLSYRCGGVGFLRSRRAYCATRSVHQRAHVHVHPSAHDPSTLCSGLAAHADLEPYAKAGTWRR